VLPAMVAAMHRRRQPVSGDATIGSHRCYHGCSPVLSLVLAGASSDNRWCYDRLLSELQAANGGATSDASTMTVLRGMSGDATIGARRCYHGCPPVLPLVLATGATMDARRCYHWCSLVLSAAIVDATNGATTGFCQVSKRPMAELQAEVFSGDGGEPAMLRARCLQ
jgi:hypothetical protein